MRSRRSLPLSEVYRLLEPGPVVLLSTAHKGRRDVMAMSWHMMIEFEPPLVGCIVSNRHFSYDLLRRSGECAINIPEAGLLAATVACGNRSGRGFDKFEKFGLTPLPARRVGAPLVAECPVNLECRVAERRLVRKYCLFVLEVVQAWRATGSKRLRTFHHLGRGEFMIAGRIRRVPSRAK